MMLRLYPPWNGELRRWKEKMVWEVKAINLITEKELVILDLEGRSISRCYQPLVKSSFCLTLAEALKFKVHKATYDGTYERYVTRYGRISEDGLAEMRLDREARVGNEIKAGKFQSGNKW